MKVHSDPWHDGTWWEAELPQGWSSLGRDKTRKGWPHTFRSPNGAHLFVHVNDGSKGTTDVSCAPSGLTPAQKIAYAVTASSMSNDEIAYVDFANKGALEVTSIQVAIAEDGPKRLEAAAAKPKRIDRGSLVGFVRPPGSDANAGWSGTFAIGAYWLVSGLSMEEWNDADADSSLDLLASITVHPPQS